MADPSLIIRAPVLLSKAGTEDDSYFQLAFGFIPTFNLGSALGIENGFLRFALDAGLDPINFLSLDRKSTRLNSSHLKLSRMPSSA